MCRGMRSCGTPASRPATPVAGPPWWDQEPRLRQHAGEVRGGRIRADMGRAIADHLRVVGVADEQLHAPAHAVQRVEDEVDAGVGAIEIGEDVRTEALGNWRTGRDRRQIEGLQRRGLAQGLIRIEEGITRHEGVRRPEARQQGRRTAAGRDPSGQR